jgi:hypothetical protein
LPNPASSRSRVAVCGGTSGQDRLELFSHFHVVGLGGDDLAADMALYRGQRVQAQTGRLLTAPDDPKHFV